MKRAEFTPLGAERTSAPAPVTKNVALAGTWDVGRGTWEVGRRKWEVGSRKWDVGSGKWDVGSGKCHTATRSPAQRTICRAFQTARKPGYAICVDNAVRSVTMH